MPEITAEDAVDLAYEAYEDKICQNLAVLKTALDLIPLTKSINVTHQENSVVISMYF